MGEPHLTSKLQGFGTTIFAEMSALAVATGAINLGQGFPDTDGPDEVRRAALDAIAAGRGNQYPPGLGVPELRQAITAHQQRFYGLMVDPDQQVLVTCGATEAIAAALLALLDDGDEAIAFEPYYDSYAACISMAGATRRPVTLRTPDFALDVDALRAAVTPRTRIILLNSPHNPTGKVFDRAELSAIAAVAQEHDLLVVADEVYEHLTFDDIEHVPIATLPGMWERTVTIGSAGKSFSFTGWKVGWATGPAPLVERGAHGQAVPDLRGQRPVPVRARRWGWACPMPTSPSSAPTSRASATVLAAGLERAGLEVFRPEGTYFVTADIRSIGEEDGLAFCRTLPERCGVVAVPNVVFYDDVDAGRSLVRFAFCKRMGVLEAAVDRLTGLRTERSSP